MSYQSCSTAYNLDGRDKIWRNIRPQRVYTSEGRKHFPGHRLIVGPFPLGSSVMECENIDDQLIYRPE